MLDEAESRLAREQRSGWLRGSCSYCPLLFFECSATGKMEVSSFSASLPTAALAQKSQQRCWTVLSPSQPQLRSLWELVLPSEWGSEQG